MQLEDYTTGTVSISIGSTTLTGSGTAWDVAPISGVDAGKMKSGDVFFKGGYAILIKTVVSDTEIELQEPWPAASLTDATYVIRYEPDNSRMQGTTRLVLDQLRQGIWLTPDATGKTADKATYDDRPTGFRFLDVSVDPFKLYVKLSDTSADWSEGASWVGPAGNDGTGTGDMLASIYDTDGDGKVDEAEHAESADDADSLGGEPAASYAPLSSPALTDIPTTPTAALTDDSTQIANTAFVQALVAELNPPGLWLPANARAAVNYELPGPQMYRATRSGERASTGTYLDRNGILQTAAIDALRINYDGAGNRLGALFEGTATNIITHSGDMSSGFAYPAATGAAAADLGGGTGARLITATNTSAPRAQQSLSALTAGMYGVSLLLKPGTADYFHTTLGGDQGAVRMYGRFSTLATGSQNVAGGAASAITLRKFDADWYLASYLATFSVDITSGRIFYVGPASGLSQTATVGDSVTVWAPQIEAGDKVTSRILTDISAGLRAADVETISPSDQTSSFDWYAKYDDDSTGKIASAVTGDFEVDPTDLSRPNVKMIWAEAAA